MKILGITIQSKQNIITHLIHDDTEIKVSLQIANTLNKVFANPGTNRHNQNESHPSS